MAIGTGSVSEDGERGGDRRRGDPGWPYRVHGPAAERGWARSAGGGEAERGWARGAGAGEAERGRGGRAGGGGGRGGAGGGGRGGGGEDGGGGGARRGGAGEAERALGLLEVGLGPDPDSQVVLDPGDVLLGHRAEPAPRLPAPDA